MANRTLKKSELVNSRITLLFFYTLLLGGVLWAENFARYHYDYIFRAMLPWLLPALAALSIALVVFLLLNYAKVPKENAVFSDSFLIYMAAPLPLLFLVPWLSMFGKGFHLFKLSVLMLLCGLVGYFISYILYHKIRPAASLLCWSLLANGLALGYFYRMYLSSARYILNGAEFGYLPAWAMALILCALLIIVMLFCIMLGNFKQFRLAKYTLIVPVVFSALLFLATVLLDSLLSCLWLRILIFGGIGLQVLWLMLQCLIIKMKK